MAFSNNPLGPTLTALAVAVGLAAVASLAGHLTVQPAHDAWRSDLTAAQEQAAEARAEAEAEAEQQERAEAEAEAAKRADERRQQAQQALSRSMGGPGAGPSAGGPASSGGGYNPLAPAGGGQAAEADDVPRNAEFGNLPDTDGVETVYVNCTGCHSATLFTQQRMTRERWDYTLDWMVSSGGMAELPDDDRAVVLDYLVRHFSS